MDWLVEYFGSLTLTKILTIGSLMILSFGLSFVIVALVLVNIPKDFFRSDYEHHLFSDRHPVIRWIAIVSKNLLGICLIATGIILSLPGIPGQGLLTILIGLILTDIPGKRSLEVKLLSRPPILAAVNRLRQKYHRAPLQLDQ